MERRKFLKILGLGAALAPVLPLLQLKTDNSHFSLKTVRKIHDKLVRDKHLDVYPFIISDQSLYCLGIQAAKTREDIIFKVLKYA